MSALSDYLKNSLLNHILRNTNYSRPAITYVALYTTTPTDTGGGVEISTVGTGYLRQPINTGESSGWGIPVAESGGGYKSTNSANIVFDIAAINWGTIKAVALWDDVSAGNMLFWSLLTPNVVINAGDQFKILNGNFSVIFR